MNKIDFLIIELEQLRQTIANCYQVTMSIENIELRQIYATEVLPIIDDYVTICYELIEALEKYFEIEKKEHLPANLKYHKLYKEII
jgi:hypothetical protein